MPLRAFAFLGALLCLAVVSVIAEGEPTTETRARNGGYIGMFFREKAPGVVTIERIHPGSGAEPAGLKAGDVVLGVDGRPVVNGDRLIQRMWGGRPFTLKIKRREETLDIETSTNELDAYAQVGDAAPRFRLPLRDGSGDVALADLLGKGKPVVLVFGSFT